MRNKRKTLTGDPEDPDLLDLYLDKISSLSKTQRTLHDQIIQKVRLIPSNALGYMFFPKEQTILAQIRNWPEDSEILPIPSWVEPRKGKVEFNGHIWEYLFHGIQQLSFIDESTHQDVTIDYSAHGDIGFTEWTVRIFLETFDPREKHFTNLLTQHNQLFAQLVQLEYLVEVPPKPFFEEQVFVLRRME